MPHEDSNVYKKIGKFKLGCQYGNTKISRLILKWAFYLNGQKRRSLQRDHKTLHEFMADSIAPDKTAIVRARME